MPGLIATECVYYVGYHSYKRYPDTILKTLIYRAGLAMAVRISAMATWFPMRRSRYRVVSHAPFDDQRI